MIVRTATTDDAPGIRSVSLAAGQPETDSGADADYLRLLLTTGRILVADDGNAVVGWGATRTTPFGAMLTDLFVPPALQGSGIGGSLLAQLWPDTSDAAPRYTFASQHAAALPLYVRAGLTPWWPLLYVRGTPGRLPLMPERATRVPNHVAGWIEAERTGLDRAADYAYWTRHDGSSAILVHQGDREIAVGAAGADCLFHLCVLDDVLADVALVAAMRALPSTTVSVCIPGPHPALADLLRQGFRIADHDTYMSTDRSALPVTFAYSPGLG